MNLKLKITKDRTYLVLFILPAILLVSIFFIIPNILNFYYSFTDWSSYKSTINFVGLYNFKELFGEGDIIKDLWTTIKYSVMVGVITNVVALILALALEKTTRLNTFFRTIIFIPVLLSTLAAGYIFKGILSPDGPLNVFLSFLTGREVDFAYLGSLKYSLFILAVIHSWKYLGIALLVYIAGLNVIPEELIEAARVEGASYIRVVKDVKLPLLGPAFTFNIVTSLIGALTTLEIVLAVTRGGPARVTEVLNMFILREFGTGKYGYTVAISLVLFIIICLFAFPMVLYLKKREIEL
jgi:raffinose/stachyose/melibiose transport system permease protein